MLIVSAAVIGVLVLAVIACRKLSNDCAMAEQQEEPCENCLRWEECNGVDEQCPYMKED